jgi:ABC-2 type transport system ATP-binding protein
MTDASAPAIQVIGLTKLYDKTKAVDEISFEVRRGEIFGLLGPNGAGKTTTINLLTGLARPSSGSIGIFGASYSDDLRTGQHLMGVVPSENNLYEELDGFENLCFCASLYGMPRVEREKRARELLELVGLDSAGKKKFVAYSRGMQRRLTIAAGIIHNPPILFLDEPTTGIDVASARQIRQMIRQLNEQNGTTVFLTTHYIEEAERLCDRVAFIVEGRIVGIDSVESLVQDVHGRHIMQFSFDGAYPNPCEELQIEFQHVKCEAVSSGVVRIVSPEKIDITPFIKYFESKGIEVTEARKIQPSLEDVFVRVTGLAAEEMKREKEGKSK